MAIEHSNTVPDQTSSLKSYSLDLREKKGFSVSLSLGKLGLSPQLTSRLKQQGSMYLRHILPESVYTLFHLRQLNASEIKEIVVGLEVSMGLRLYEWDAFVSNPSSYMKCRGNMNDKFYWSYVRQKLPQELRQGSKYVPSKSIEDLGLTKETLFILQREGVSTIRDLTFITPRGLLHLPSFKKEHFWDVVTSLSRVELQLAEWNQFLDSGKDFFCDRSPQFWNRLRQDLSESI